MCRKPERTETSTWKRRLRAPTLLSLLAVVSVLSVSTAPPARAQDSSLEASRKRLQQIRRERERLEEQQLRLQGQVHDVNDELTNLERQRESTERIVSEI